MPVARLYRINLSEIQLSLAYSPKVPQNKAMQAERKAGCSIQDKSNDIDYSSDGMTESGEDIGWCVYALRCKDSSIYIGSTNNLNRRLTQHDNGTGSKFVRARRPFEIARVISCRSSREAHQLEYRLKKLKRRKKLEELSLDHGGRPLGGSTDEPAS
jgi:putative endonuclease